MSLPYYKRFPRDFLDGTIGLSLEEKGAYGIVLDLIYMRDGKLEDNAQYIAGQLGCSVRKWLTIREKLFSIGKIECNLGFISNSRADKLMVEARLYQDKQAENGKQPKQNNGVKKPPLKPNVKPEANQSDTDIEESSLDKSKHTLSGESAKEFEDFVLAYPKAEGRNAARDEWDAAIAAGATPESILAGLAAAQSVWNHEKREKRWIKNAGTWLADRGWLDHAPIGGTHTEADWGGPDPIRKAIVAAIGKDAARSCFEKSEWDGEQIIPQTTWVLDKLKGVPGVREILAPVRKAA